MGRSYLGLRCCGVEAERLPGPVGQRRAPQYHHSQSLGRTVPHAPSLSPADLSTKSSIRLTRSWYVVLTGDRVDTST